MEKFLITKENIKVLTDRFSKLIGNRYKNRWKDFNDTDRSMDLMSIPVDLQSLYNGYSPHVFSKINPSEKGDQILLANQKNRTGGFCIIDIGNVIVFGDNGEFYKIERDNMIYLEKIRYSIRIYKYTPIEFPKIKCTCCGELVEIK